MSIRYDLFDISKDKTSLIQIDSFATHMNKYSDGNIIVYKNFITFTSSIN